MQSNTISNLSTSIKSKGRFYFENKSKLINKLGTPSYIDPIENKFFYFSEVSEKKSIFKKRDDMVYDIFV